MEADPVGVQRRTVPHFKDLFKIFKMTYSMSLYSDGIIFKFRFQKSRFTPKKRSYTLTYVHVCTILTGFQAHIHVHYWANGVAQLINAKKSSWPLAKEIKHQNFNSFFLGNKKCLNENQPDPHFKFRSQSTSQQQD